MRVKVDIGIVFLFSGLILTLNNLIFEQIMRFLGVWTVTTKKHMCFKK